MSTKKNPDRNLIVALDVGTSEIKSLVGQITAEDEIEVIGFGAHPSKGLKRGVVVDVESTVQSIQRAIEEAELMSGRQIRAALTGIAGSHIRGLNSHGIVAISNREVHQSDVDRVIDAAKAVAIPADQRILHVIPQEYIVDAQEGVREPLGMSGVRLEAKVHIVTGAVSAAQNIIKCLRRCGLQVGDIILEQLASSHSVLTDDEKELGVCLVDIGGGTTDIAVFTNGAIRYTSVIPVAGDQVTNDLAVALRTPTQYAEQIKLKQATVLTSDLDSEETIHVPSVAKRPPRQIAKKLLTHVASARYEELFQLIQNELRRNNFEDLMTAGIVLTGGASNMPGVIELAESVFRMPVRLGLPQNVNGLMDVRDNPSYATGVGLLLHGLMLENNKMPLRLDRNDENIWSRMKSWFTGNF